MNIHYDDMNTEYEKYIEFHVIMKIYHAEFHNILRSIYTFFLLCRRHIGITVLGGGGVGGVVVVGVRISLSGA